MGTVSLLAIGVQREGQASDTTVEEVAGWFREQQRRREARWLWIELGELLVALTTRNQIW